jgi:type IV pilus assembly protein PilA
MKKAFTLVEILVVLIIIGALLALVVPNAFKAINEANKRNCAANLRNVDSAIQLCYTQTRNWASCDTLAELTAGNYLEATPSCPFSTAYAVIENPAGGQGYVSEKSTHFADWPVITTHVGVTN